VAKKTRYTEKLERIARESSLTATQAKIIEEVINTIPDYLETSKPITILSPETVILEHYEDLEKCWQWLNPALLTYLEADQDFNRLTTSSVVHRFVLLPLLPVETNSYKQQMLRKTILIHLHVQLWFGVICGVYFLDPKKINIREVIDQLNFASIPEQNFFYDVPGFHSEEHFLGITLRDDKAKKKFEEVKRWFAPSKDFPIWIFYDEKNFEGNRLKGWRWKNLRLFFHYLYGKRVFCDGCGHDVENFSLDHIAPISRSYFQTLINFQPLCRSCNSAKRDIEGLDPFGLGMLIPEYLRTRQLDDILRLAPPWLGRITRPNSQKDIYSRLFR
jgi:hypothetical protein